MSYCEIIPFKDGLPIEGEGIEFGNSHGGCGRVWNTLFDKYLKNPAIPYHSWLGDREAAKLWALADRPDLPDFERAVHIATFDRAYVRRENFTRYTAHLRAFVSSHPVPGRVDHLRAWADAIGNLEPDVEAIGFYGMSVSENLWFVYDPETEEAVPQNLSTGFEVYTYLQERTPENLCPTEN